MLDPITGTLFNRTRNNPQRPKQYDPVEADSITVSSATNLQQNLRNWAELDFANKVTRTKPNAPWPPLGRGRLSRTRPVWSLLHFSSCLSEGNYNM